MSLKQISRELCKRVDALHFSAPISHVYNPLAYARAPHEQYLTRYGAGPKQVLFLGMNPGPFGMAQTGVPFGDVGLVRDWMGITAKVGRPAGEHPARPITGFDCARSEVSGARLWGWARERFVSPERFFERFFVVNYCPLCFMESSGKNFTPDKLPKEERALLLEVCDRALVAIATELSPQWVIGVGAFAQACAARALQGMDVRIGTILHPSPASPLANRGWASAAEAQLTALGITLPHL
jgi:single-strand selective monofunctional uracil DNA glycosylase